MSETATAPARPAKPPYLGLLNALSLAESEAGVYLEAWANTTTNEELAKTLRFVAARESSHGDIFCRRIAELGFSLLQKPDPGAAQRLAKYANPRISDAEKAGEEHELNDPFKDIERQINDGMFDPLTEKLLTWYIAEERDSGRMLRECYSTLRGSAPASMNGHSDSKSMGSGPSSDAQAIMECMTAGFTRLEKALEKLAKK